MSYVTIGSLLFLSAYFIYTSYYHHLKFKQEDKLNQLSAIVKTLSLQLDGDAYEKLIRKNQGKEKIDIKDPLYLEFHNLLKEVYEYTGLASPIYLLTFDKQQKQFSFGVSSSEGAIYGQAYEDFPADLERNYIVGGEIGRYQTKRGQWLSAFTPIKNSRGETIAVLQADSPFREFRSVAFKGLLQNTLMSCLVVLLFIYTIRNYMQRVLHLIKEKELAEEKAEIKAKFLSTMSHEIRTPMNAVIGLTNIMLDEKPREDQKENLKTLKFSADLLLALINDVLDYSKLEAGEIHFEKISFNLHQLMHNISNTLRVQSEKKNLPLEVNIASDVPEYIVNDSVRLSQIITNLAGNAIKFTDKGKVSINLSLLDIDDNMANIRFAIKDTGIGIPADKFDTIFQSFSQADSATTRKFGGTGLGLSITKRMLELQDSTIQLESELGEGSTFFFDLVMPIGEQKSTKKDIDPTLPIASDLQFDGNHILLVEDNKINVMVAMKFLKKWGLRVDVAENGQIALDKIQQNNYELVLMDLDMPVLDGYEATAAIRDSKEERISQLPIIALSASAVSDFREKAMELGMNEYVTKPFKPEELYGVLSGVLSGGVEA
ncbi:MAG: signal transduction histidine kinase [Flavobacteriales bacterium]|jgi:signal transduction histidine kinase